MLYYKVKEDLDQRPRYKYIGTSNERIKCDGILIGNELYTPRERERIANADKYFEKVEISPRKTYWCFGARFSNDDAPIIPLF